MENQSPKQADAAQDEPVVVATLWLPKNKGSRANPVYGASGVRYQFKWDPKRRIACRDYTKLEKFEREHLDMARQPHFQQPVCVLMAHPHPARRATEAVEALIKERMKIAVAQKLLALEQICESVSAEIKRLKSQGIVAAPEPPNTPQSKPVITPQPDGDDAPVESEIDDAPEPADEIPHAGLPTVIPDEPTLQVMPIDNLKALAAEHGIKGKRSRRDLVEALSEGNR